ncbi:MAG: ABC transporter ATP-binding protein [Bryobacteraceae bacterium]|nr:ABC transporter ATP-binding protein [Bryobacteraceae bacterium]
MKELLTLNRRRYHRDFWALRDLNVEIHKGETFCVVGENGSGKSTMLQLAAGILQPTAGQLEVHGRVAALLELGSGFNPEFTGRENVFLNGAILGLSTEEMESRYAAIADFAEIGDFLHQPVKTFSSGMIVRLAFAVAIHVDPDILLVDEALAVGDHYFRQRCMRKVHELRNRGVTILFVSHSTADVKALGDRALWLDHGETRELGATERVVTKYLAAMHQKDQRYSGDAKRTVVRQVTHNANYEFCTSIPNVDHRFGSGAGSVIGIGLFDSTGEPLQELSPNSRAVIRISVKAHQLIPSPNIGFMMRNHLGVDFAGTNCTREGVLLDPMEPGEIRTVDFYVELPTLYATSFSFSPALADGDLDQYVICDWVENALVLQMLRAEGPVYGQIHLPCRVLVNHPLGAEAPAAVPGDSRG